MPRCAIYTRKSTDEGLEQEFNSLDAQREACASFIKSQKHEGWKVVRETFEDGGYSGGSMRRPGLQKLLTGVRQRSVDVIVVYKVDRLSRSLTDFTRMVEIFDAHEVSFVSVTQAFNTTSSMGRLTLNVLLSFAQFEREVTSERIRDKIAASKQKGMWMGGSVPLGYDAVDKKLVVNGSEAETVRTLFRLYLEHGTVRRLKQGADRCDLVTKRRTSPSDQVTGGKPFSRGNLYQLLSNPIYAGRIAHRGVTHDGQHDAIVDDETWQAVQLQLKENAAARRTGTNAASPSLLTGLIYDETGDRLSPSHACKSAKRYRYYISHRLMHGTDTHTDGWRMPARNIEAAVCDALAGILRDQNALGFMLGDRDVFSLHGDVVTVRIEQMITDLGHGSINTKRDLLQSLVNRIDLSEAGLSICVNKHSLADLVGIGSSQLSQDTHHRITLPIALKRRGVERKIVLQDPSIQIEKLDLLLCRTIAQAYHWMTMLADGTAETIREIAARIGVPETEVSRLLLLAFLAPDIVEAILGGTQPIDLTTQKIRRIGRLPASWKAQRAILGFPATV